MNQAETLGPELVMLFRREAAAMAELKYVRETIGARLREIREAESAALYAHTGEMGVVAPAGVPPAPAPERFERLRNLGPQPRSRHHADPGDTFALNPVAAAVTEHLPAPVPCPRQDGQDCPEMYPHLHLADGSVTRVRDLGFTS